MENLEMKNISFWKDKRVLLTGHTGFKGSWLLFTLLQLGAKVFCYSLEPKGEKNLYVDLFKDNPKTFKFNEFIGDIRDEKSLSKWIGKAQPEIVFHLAAQPLVRESFENPIYTWDVNVKGSLVLLESLKQIKHKCSVVMVTTDKVYLNKEQKEGYDEKDQLGGVDPYSASKAASELAIASWRSSFCGFDHYQKTNLKIATARAGNVIGGGDWSKDRIIPDIINSLILEKTIPVRNPYSKRPWQHVLESLNGYLLLSEYLHSEVNPKCEAFNFGPNLQDSKTVEELIKEAVKTWPGNWKKSEDNNSYHESKLLNLKVNKSMKLLDWEPKWSFQKTVGNTVRWYKKVHQGTSPFDSCLDDLLNFQTS